MASAGASRELMNVELGFDQAQYGLLVSYGFSLTYTLMALPAGALCDQYPRKLLLLASATGWSAVLAASAVAATYGQLLASRVMLGIAQALATPAAVTLIADLFPPSRRATATSVYSSGIYLGGALASLSVVMSRSIGWRATASVVAASSALPMLLLAALLREPPRTTSPPPARPASKPSSAGTAPVGGKSELGGASLSERLHTVLGVKSVRFLLAATAARFFGGFAIGAWTAPFYRMHFPSHATLFSLLNALVVAGGGSLSAICGGVIADKLVRANRPDRVALVPAVGALVAIPCWVLAMQAPSFFVSMAGLLAAYLAAECWYGATISMIQSGLSPAVWGTAQGALNMVQIIGNGSPLLMGALLRKGVPLRSLATAVVPASYLLCALLFWRASVARESEMNAV